MSQDLDRPVPEALLAEAAREGRGRLKIFLGAAPGVGKTYAMLEEALRRERDSDVVVGVVETHGRADTEALAAGLEVVPRRPIYYRGRAIPEMDLDAILARRPALVLVDELAHSNVPGSTHVKRWQDVEEILAAGIDVFTTLNIQHLESLNDVVARISGVRVRETLPDQVLERADEIELIDVPPEELLERLRQGKVYVQEQIARAIQNFFSKGNLTALRELALRVAADRVDAQMTEHMRSHAIAGPWPTHERMLVCVNESPVSASLIRATKRMADRARAPWIAAHVIAPGYEQLSEADKTILAESLRLAESLGAEVVTLNTDRDVAAELLAFARSRNVSRIVVGRPRRRRFPWANRERVSRRLIDRGGDFQITLVSPDEETQKRSVIQPGLLTGEPDLRLYLLAVGVTLGAFAVALAIDRFFPVASLSLVFLTGVLIVATRAGIGPSLMASTLSFLLYNYFFTVPYRTLAVHGRDDILTLLLFLLVAITTGNLAARIRRQAMAQRAIARRTANLYEFSRKVASAASEDDVLWAAVHHVASTLQCRSLVLTQGSAGGSLEVVAGYPPEDQLNARDRAAADWAWAHGEAAGRGSATLPTSEWLFLPLRTAHRAIGLLGVAFDRKGAPNADERRLLDTLGDQVALALERTHLVADLQQAGFAAETDKLRSALLSSVSHDLRTPLAALLGAAGTLQQSGALLSEEARRELVESILEQGNRLNRFVQNLLDMTRLGYGVLRPNVETVDLSEILGAAIRRLGRSLAGHRVASAIAADADGVSVDPVLMEQVLANLLDNAANYAPVGTEIRVSTTRQEGAVLLAVEDEGPGIPEAHRERVFDMFYRVRADDGQKAGTGLGLSICRGLIEAHGGTIRATARADGSGTRIEIRLPDRPAGEAPR